MSKTPDEKEAEVAMDLTDKIISELPKDILPAQAIFSLMCAAACLACDAGADAQRHAPKTFARLVKARKRLLKEKNND